MKYDTEQMTFVGAAATAEESAALRLHYEIMAAAQAAEIGVIIICCHHTCAVALGAFHLDAGGQGVVCTVCKVGFINDSAHAPAHSFQKITFTAETGMVSNLLL